MSSPEQSGPIVVYGATGYTGKLVAAELARRGADFVIAGRSPSKLNALAATLAAGPGVVAVALDDAAGLRALLRDAAAVIACAGPFALCGEAVLTAAVETGTHYVDTTGEQPFIRKVFDEYGPKAEATGAALLSGMGFDYAPGDLIASLTGAGIEGPIDQLTIAYAIRGFSPTRGTALSTLEMIGGGDLEWVGGKYREASRKAGRGRFH
ncbi:MAG: saccharopine dehydrogenase NADP-binding domain-containing protein, partial [Solirubrobacterales bacterium]